MRRICQHELPAYGDENYRGLSHFEGPRTSGAELGFTLIELLVVISIIGILAYLGLTSFYVYRSDAAYSVINTTFRNARTSGEASLNDLDNPPVLTNASQAAQGPITDPSAQTYLPGMQLPRNVTMQVRYNPACVAAGCEAEFLEFKHCVGNEYLQWIRLGDGTELHLDHLAGAGCG